jgi:tetratricopeptide (TPR) repeat protein
VPHVGSWLDSDDISDGADEFADALAAGRLDDARALAERHVGDPEIEEWVVPEMLEQIGLLLAEAGRHDDAIETFERALEVGWDVVPDGRCEIARVLLLAGRHEEADALWTQLRAADDEADAVWTLNAGGLAYNEIRRDELAVQWLGAGLRVAIDREDPERVVDQLSDARRVSLRRLGLDRDGLELEVETFLAAKAARDEERAAELRRQMRRAGLAVAGRTVTAAWMSEHDDRSARERWPGWAAGVLMDGPFAERAAHMERSLRERRADGDGPLLIVTIDLERYAAWCEDEGYDPADRRSRGTFLDLEAEAGAAKTWPPGRNEPCWCTSGLKYKRCCGALTMSPTTEAAA